MVSLKYSCIISRENRAKSRDSREIETVAAQLFAVKESLHHLRDCIVFNRQPFKTLQEGCRYAYDQDRDLPCGLLGYGDLGDRLDRRKEAMTADDLDTWINYLLEGKQ